MTLPLVTDCRLRPVTLALLLALLVFACTYPSLALVAPRYLRWDENLSHGLMVWGLFIAFYMRPLALGGSFTLSARLCWSGLLASLLLWLVGSLMPLDLLAQLALLPLLFFVLACSLGARQALGFSPAIGLLLFALPVWEQLVPLLVLIAAKVVGTSVGLLGVELTLESTRLYIAAGSITITDDCSGVRYLSIALGLGYVLCLLNNYSWRMCLLVMTLALLLGLLANWLRIIVIVLVGVDTHLQSPLMDNHEYFGWLLFALLMLPWLYWAPASRRPQASSARIALAPARLLIVVALLTTSALIYWTTATAALNAEVKPLADRLPLAYAPLNKARMPLVIEAGSALGAQEFGQLTRADAPLWAQLDQYHAAPGSLKLVPYFPRRARAETSPSAWQLQQSQPISAGSRRFLASQWRTPAGAQAITLQWFRLGDFQTATLWQAKLRQTQARAAGVTQFSRITLSQMCAADCRLQLPQLLDTATHLDQSL